MPTKNYNPKKYHIITYGCQANIADSNVYAGILEALGFEEVFAISEADLVVINTCSVRQKAEDKVYGLGKELKRISDSGKPLPFVVMAGCMVGSVTGDRQRYEFEVLKKKTPWVSAYLNPSQILELPRILGENKVIGDWALQKLNLNEVLAKQPDKNSAFVNISYGCDNFCTFCVVPYARGKEVSRPKEHILAEISHLAKQGISHITLCGQNVNSWGLDMKTKFAVRAGSDDKLPFADLLREVHEIVGIEKISFISSNPFDFTEDLIQALKLPKMDNYLHMAVQSGNNEVLKRMNRRHTIEDFYALVDRIKEVKPDIVLGTDIIVGFPGETYDQFMDTVELFKKVKFKVAFISIYSVRKGTPADKFYEDDVPLKEKKRRHAELSKVWKANKD